MIARQYDDRRSGIPGQNLQQRQQDATCRSAVARLNDYVSGRQDLERLLPPAPMLGGDDDANPVNRGDDQRSLQRFVQQRRTTSQRTKLFGYRNTRRRGGETSQPGTASPREDERPTTASAT